MILCRALSYEENTLDEHRRDVPSLDSGQHFLKTGTLHRRTRDTVIHEKDCVGITLVLGGLLKYLPLILDSVHVWVGEQKEGSAEIGSRVWLLWDKLEPLTKWFSKKSVLKKVQEKVISAIKTAKTG